MWSSESNQRAKTKNFFFEKVSVCSQQFLWSIGFCVLVIVLVRWGTGMPEWRDIIASENGPVERMSAGLWFMGCAWCLGCASVQRIRRVEWLGLGMFLLLFGLRELDAHVWATGWNLDKLANYWNARYPLSERLMVFGCMIAPVLIVTGIIGYRLWPVIGMAWRTGETWLFQLGIGILLLILCVILDKVGAYALPFFGFNGTEQDLVMIMEEFLEFVLGVFSLTMLWPYFQEALDGGDEF